VDDKQANFGMQGAPISVFCFAGMVSAPLMPDVSQLWYDGVA
jgi:hypothetical protein